MKNKLFSSKPYLHYIKKDNDKYNDILESNNIEIPQEFTPKWDNYTTMRVR